jgi:hypothetical protein
MRTPSHPVSSALVGNAYIGAALLDGSKCPECRKGVTSTKFVGTPRALPHALVTETEGSDGSDGLSEWGIQEMDGLALTAVDSKQVTILHLPKDNVSPLYGNPVQESRWL